MKKLTPLLLALFLASITIQAQSNVYEFDAKHTKTKSNRYKEVPAIYKVENKQLYYTIKPKIEKLTNQYLAIETKVNEVVKDSIFKNNAHYAALNKLEASKKINQLINSYLVTAKPHELKKRFLIDAQSLASKHNITELIYADNSINSSKKSKFMILKLNSLDLKVHLKRVSSKCDQIARDIIIPKIPEELNNQLAELRKTLSKTEKFYYEIGAPQKASKETLAIINKVKDASSVTGKHKIVRDYFVMKSTYGTYAKDELVSKTNVFKYKIPGEFLLDSSLKVLIKNLETNNLYIVNHNYIENYVFKINGQHQYTPTDNIATTDD